MRFKYVVKLSDTTSRSWAGHRKNAILSVFHRKHLTYKWNRVLVIQVYGAWGFFTRISRWIKKTKLKKPLMMSGELGNETSMYLLNLQHCLRQISPCLGTMISIGFFVEKLMLLSFRGNLGEIESETKWPRIVHRTILLWMGNNVSGSAL